MRIIHLTDPHLSTLDGVSFTRLRGKRLLGYQSWYRNRRHRYLRSALDKIVAAVAEHRAELIVVTGDLVHIGLESEFAAARQWLESLGPASQVRLIPGNHDCYHRESWALAHAAYADYLMGDPQAYAPADHAAGYPGTERFGEAVLVGASSAHPAPWWGAIGTLGAAQRQRIAEALGAASDAFRVFALHHPPLPGACSRRKALTDDAALKHILEQGCPHITLHGHLHRNITLAQSYGRIYCTASASSVREQAPASYRLFDITSNASGWEVHMTLRQLASARVTTVEEQTFRLD